MRRRRIRLALGGLVAVVIAAVAMTSAPAPVGADPAWAPAGSATIHPGVQTNSEAGQCTANFVFTDGTNAYIGQAAHCTSAGGATDTDGCLAPSLPLGSVVQIQGASQPGILEYSSWVTMQALDETDADTCAFNDFALVKIAAADVSKVNPSIPHWGGPNGINTAGTATGARVYSYGNSSLRAGITTLSPKTGISLGTDSGGWNHPVYTASPGIPGDSGSAFLDAQGRALGVLATLQAAPLVLSNGVGDLNHELQYMWAHTTLDAIHLALGTVTFDGSKLPLGI